MKKLMTTIATCVALAVPGVAIAQDLTPHVNARKALMGLFAYNLGVLGGMAQGQTPYDADAARAAATSL